MYKDLFNYDLKMLEDYFPNYDYDFSDPTDPDTYIIVDGKRYQAEMTLSPYVDEMQSQRIQIDGEYYYF